MRETWDTVVNGDCLEVMAGLEPESVDLIFADPPYWMRTSGELKRVEGTTFDGVDDAWDQFSGLADYERFTREWLAACRRVLKPNGSLWVIGGMQCIHTIGAIMQDLGFWIVNDVVWRKSNPTPNFHGTRLTNSHETLIWATKSKDSKYTFNYKTARELNTDTVSSEDYAAGVRKQMGSIWTFPVCSGSERLKDASGKKLHSTQKPLALLMRVVAISSHYGDLVLDPFGGTMTTGVAAKILGRHYLMIEQDEAYCDAGIARLALTAPEDGPIARATFDERPPRARMADMIEQGYFTAGEGFYLRDGRKIATLRKDGKLDFEGEILDMHTLAARARGAKATRLNGFEVWQVKREGELVPIKAIRADFRKGLTVLSD